jgi:HK97 family phage major capsid protein
MPTVRELRDRRATVLDAARALVEAAEAEDRDLTQEEQGQYDQHINEAGQLETRINRLESMPELQPVPQNRRAPAVLRHGRGDSEVRALAAWTRTGDRGAVRDLLAEDERGAEGVEILIPTGLQMRSANDTIMNITTAADGNVAVPTGFAGDIARRRNEVRLAERLGVRMIPGVGTTVNYPYEDGDPNAFAATDEQNDAHEKTYERDAPKLANKAFTLAKKTKKLELTEELLDDEDANLMSYISDYIGRAIGITHNSLLLTEVGAYGTALKEFASATAIADGEPDDLVFHDTLGYYLDDGDAPSWVMRPTTFGAIKEISGNARVYGDAKSPSRTLLEYPVFYSNQAAAIAATAKSLYFGNWYYVGMREDPALRLIRDPYTVDGMVLLKYSFRTCYGVLIAGAIGYGVHPSA